LIGAREFDRSKYPVIVNELIFLQWQSADGVVRIEVNDEHVQKKREQFSFSRPIMKTLAPTP